MKRIWKSMVGLVVIGIGFVIVIMWQKKEPLSSSHQEYRLADGEQIWVVTDLHHLSRDLIEEGEAFSYIERTAAGKDLRYGRERMEALVEQVASEAPRLLLVSGDLSFNGERKSMEELATYFHQIEASGTQVLLVPGNHDIASGWARAFKGEEQIKTDQVSKEEFATLFADFGFREAASQDEASLSYLAKPFRNLWLLMLDSNIYASGYGKGAPPTNGRLKPATLDWLEAQLKEAETAGVTVLPVLHHNVLDQHPVLHTGYTLDNASDLRHLFATYGVHYNLSGHTHAQQIVQTQLDGSTYTEVVTGAFSIYPAAIGKLTMTAGNLLYQKETLDMSAWEAHHRPTQPELIDHTAYLAQLFDRDTDSMVHTVLYEEGWYDGELADDIARFVVPINRAYFSGERLDREWLEAEVYPSSAYQQLGEHQPTSFLWDYVQYAIRRSQDKEMETILLEKDK